MTATTARKCIDSDTQVMVRVAYAGQHVTCGNCGQTVTTYTRKNDTNQIPFLTAHTMR